MNDEQREPNEPPLSWLLDISKTRLHTFHLKQLNKAANSRKQLSILVEEWIEERALALLSAWFIEFGEELIARAAEPRQSSEEETSAKPEELPVAKPQRFEFWRFGERRRNSRRRAG